MLPGVVVMVSSDDESYGLAGSLRRLSTETTHGAETHRDPSARFTFLTTGRAPSADLLDRYIDAWLLHGTREARTVRSQWSDCSIW